MIINSWIERIGQSLKRSSRRKTDQRNGVASAGERLEERSLLSAQAFFLNGVIDIALGPTDSVAVTENPVAPGTVQIVINGTPAAAFPIVSASAVTKVSITGGDDANLIDLTGITSAVFNNAALSIVAHGGNGADTLLGSDSLADSLDGGHGADSIDGNGLNDTLLGDDGDDTINGGTGDDSIDAGDGQDVVDGNDGNDTIIAGDGQDSITGSAGNDSLNGEDGADTLLGGDGDDTLNGGADNDSLDGQNGNDSLLGGASNDTINGGSGDDTADGQGGTDSLLGGVGNDSLNGGDGHDSITGEVGNDTLNGSAGNDTLDGADGDDSILGGSGNDALFGSAGNDTVRGQSGNDSILGGGGADQLNGDAGNDLIDGGVPTVSVDDVAVTEGTGGTNNAVFTLTLSSTTLLPVTVMFSTSDGTATQGSDYTAVVNQPVNFAPGTLTQTISIPITTDNVIEPDEVFFVNLSNAVNASIFDGLGQGAILDDDNPGPDVSIGLNFTGSTFASSGFIPPDTMGTVGPNHIVEILNGVFAIYDKTTGAVLQRTTLDQFWMSTGVAGPFGTFDSRIVFDPTSQRYFATAENFGSGANGGGNSIFVGVSITSDPTAGFRATRFVADSSGVAFNDYPTMSIDADGMYLATNNFGAGFDVSIFSIPKSDLLLPIPSVANISRFENLNSGLFGDSIQASLDFGASDGRAALLSVGNGNLIRTNILGAGGPGATLQAPTPIAVNPFSPAPPGDQPGGGPTIENVSPRFTGNVVEVGDSLWGIHTVLDNATGNSAIRWYEIDEVTNAVLQQGDFGDPTIDYLDPSIAVNAAGTVVIGATGTGSGPGEFPSSYAFVGQTTAGTTAFGPRILLQAGTSTYFAGGGRNRWGDYSATVVDPVNPTSFWTFQEIAIGPSDWAVQITQLIVTPMAPPPPPPPPFVAAAGDTLTGGDGEDTLLGSEADDVINGSGGNDSLVGSGGNDSITAGSGSDVLDGGVGDDTLAGQGGKDTVIGGDGDDIFQWSAAGDGVDLVSSLGGFDQMQITATSAAETVSISKLGPRIQVTSGGNVLTVNTDIHVITMDLGNGDDVVTIGDLSGVAQTVLTINGGDGNDNFNASASVMGVVRLQLNGEAGNDSITGSASDDTISGGAGRDTLLGGNGNDAIFGGADHDAINGGTGDDSITGDDGNDTLAGGDGNDTLQGGLGNDSLTAQAGDDSLDGAEGRDTLLGGDGNDSLDAGDGKDFLTGGNGDDTLDGGRNDDTVFGDAGADTIRGNHGNDSIDAGTGDDTVNGGDGNDIIAGGDGNDLMTGGDGDDILNGAAGNDTLTGSDGNDILAGGSGNDIVLGDDGDDTIKGNGGSNTLAGGQGNDSIVGAVGEINENFVLADDLLKKLDLL